VQKYEILKNHTTGNLIFFEESPEASLQGFLDIIRKDVMST
jgi:hypothetical protein